MAFPSQRSDYYLNPFWVVSRSHHMLRLSGYARCIARTFRHVSPGMPREPNLVIILGNESPEY